MKEKIYNIFRILGIIGLAFCILYFLLSYMFDFGDGKIGSNIFLLMNLTYIILLIVVEFNKRIKAETSMFIWIMFINYLLYLYVNKNLGENLTFIYIIIALILAAFGTYKIKKKKEINVKKSTNITLVIIATLMMIYLLCSYIFFYSTLMGIA